MHYRFLIFFLLLSTLGLNSSAQENNEVSFGPKSRVSVVLKYLGEKRRDHDLDVYFKKTLDELSEEVKLGEELYYKGFVASKEGSKPISRHYQCIQCHNVHREDPDLKVSDPEARLEYITLHNRGLVKELAQAKARGDSPEYIEKIEREINYFRPGTTIYGMANRKTWFNGDYQNKYKGALNFAHTNLAGSIQMCSQYCSAGRRLQPWEEGALLAYIWSKELRLYDLWWSEKEWGRFNSEIKDPSAKTKASLREWIKSFWLPGSPATFGTLPEDLQKGFVHEREKADVANGKRVYDSACLECHKSDEAPSNLKLDHSPMSLTLLKLRYQKTSNTPYHYVIEGTEYEHIRDMSYMPLFPLERKSRQQIEDMWSYIDSGALF